MTASSICGLDSRFRQAETIEIFEPISGFTDLDLAERIHALVFCGMSTLIDCGIPKPSHRPQRLRFLEILRISSHERSTVNQRNGVIERVE